VRLGDLTENTERLRGLQSFETLFDVGCSFPAQYLGLHIIYTKAANFSLKNINYLEFEMKADCVSCGMGAEYPLYLSIHVLHKSHDIKRQCIRKYALNYRAFSFESFSRYFIESERSTRDFSRTTLRETQTSCW
jgi:hypothetical protein